MTISPGAAAINCVSGPAPVTSKPLEFVILPSVSRRPPILTFIPPRLKDGKVKGLGDFLSTTLSSLFSKVLPMIPP